MTKNPYAVEFIPCAWPDIQPLVASYITENGITVDSFWEDHVVESRHYRMTFDGVSIGYFAIHDASTITLFWVMPPYARLAQALFARIKKYEQTTGALVPTGDEFLLSHCLDDYSRIEKQAYFAIYTDTRIEPEREIPLTLREIDVNDAADRQICALSDGFLDGEIASIENGKDVLHLYVARHDEEIVGFGVIQYGLVRPDIASIGMFVRENCRRKGYAANILKGLEHMARQRGCAVVSGCWYYNHNSKKSMESAGAYSKTRLIRFFF